MTRTRGHWVVLIVTAIVTASACAQVLDADDYGVSRDADDAGSPAAFQYEAPACETCVARECPEEEDACLADATCSKRFECTSQCAVDAVSCRRDCMLAFPESSDEATALHECRRQSCFDECIGFLDDNETAECNECLGVYADVPTDCQLSAACESVDCTHRDPNRYHECSDLRATALGHVGCAKRGPRPPADQLDVELSKIVNCRDACLSDRWGCVGNYIWDPPAGTPVETAWLFGAGGYDTPMAGRTFFQCDPQSSPCVPLAGTESTIGEDGVACLTLDPTPATSALVFEVVGPDSAGNVYRPLWVYPGRPIAREWSKGRVAQFTDTLVEATLAPLGIVRRPDRGTLYVSARDCSGTTAEGVTIGIEPSDGTEDVTCFDVDPFGFRVGPCDTSRIGIAVIYNVRAGSDVRVFGYRADDPEPYGCFDVHVAASTLTYLDLYPRALAKRCEPGSAVTAP